MPSPVPDQTPRQGSWILSFSFHNARRHRSRRRHKLHPSQRRRQPRANQGPRRYDAKLSPEPHPLQTPPRAGNSRRLILLTPPQRHSGTPWALYRDSSGNTLSSPRHRKKKSRTFSDTFAKSRDLPIKSPQPLHERHQAAPKLTPGFHITHRLKIQHKTCRTFRR